MARRAYPKWAADVAVLVVAIDPFEPVAAGRCCMLSTGDTITKQSAKTRTSLHMRCCVNHADT